VRVLKLFLYVIAGYLCVAVIVAGYQGCQRAKMDIALQKQFKRSVDKRWTPPGLHDGAEYIQSASGYENV